MKLIAKYLTIAVIVTLLLPLPAQAKRASDSGTSDLPETFRKAETLPGGVNVDFSMVTLAKYKKEVNDVFNYTFSETKRIAALFDPANPASDLSQIANAAGISPVQVNKETIVLTEHAKEIAIWTRGSFDPVTGPGTYKNIKIDKKNSTIYLNKPGMGLELNWILEGFIADLFIRAAYHANIDDALVQVNGVSRSMGQNAYGPWKLMLESNGQMKAKKGMSITISNYSAAVVGGVHKAPTVNPRNGKPLETPFYSVTVLTKQAATAQGVATGIYIGGETEGENLINALGIRAIFAYKTGQFKKVGKW